MKHPHSAISALCAATLCAAAALLTPAVGDPAVQVLPVKDGARLVLRGRLITLFRTPNGSLSARERAERAAERLLALLDAGLAPRDIAVRRRGENWGVYARGGLVMIATPREAELRHEDAEVTARRWAANLKSALTGGTKPNDLAEHAAASLGSMTRKTARSTRAAKARPQPRRKAPTLGVADPSISVPVGETRTVALAGSATGPFTATVTGEAAGAHPVAGKAAVEVKGLVAGKTTVRVDREGKSVTFDVWVKKHAGRVLDMAHAQVTGQQAPGSLVRRVAREHLLDGIDREPGTMVRVIGALDGVQALARGETADVLFPISITGDGYFPVKATARVRVKNVALPARETRSLLYSNNPESVRELGILFDGALEKEGAARLFYHHQNRLGRPFLFQIHVLNPNDEAAEVQVVQADAGPILNTIQVGHRAAALYLSADQADTGYVARIPAHGSRVLFHTSLPANLTVSGIYNLRTVSGGPLVLQVIAADDLQRPKAATDRLAIARCEPDVYPTPVKDETHQYSVGDNWTFIPIGRKAISSGDRKLLGNYGVLYNLTLQLKNPTDEVRTVRVLMSAEAGWARGAFLIDGKLVESPHLAPPAEAVLHTVRLQPKEERLVKIQTIPAGGGFYPISLVVRP